MNERQGLFEALEADYGWWGRRPRQRRWKLAAVMTVVLLLLGASAPVRADTLTWTALFDQSVAYSQNATYSLRGVALSANDSVVYGTWLHGGTKNLIVEYNASTNAVLNTTTIPYPGASA